MSIHVVSFQLSSVHSIHFMHFLHFIRSHIYFPSFHFISCRVEDQKNWSICAGVLHLSFRASLPVTCLLWSGPDKYSNNFKVPVLSCYGKRGASINRQALVFVGTGLNHKSDNFRVPLICSNENRIWSNVLCIGLSWHPTPPEIGQLQGARSELLWKEGRIYQSSGLGLCWHRTQP